MNSVNITGRLTANPELRTTASGTSVISFSVAVNRYKADTIFVDCVAWKQTAEFISRYFVKGSGIEISGELSQRTWEDKNGTKHKTTEIVVNNAGFYGSKPETQTVIDVTPEHPEPTIVYNPPEEIVEDDLPF